jgi:hypothetical protein
MTTAITTTIATTTRGRKRRITRKNKTCEKCGIERKTMYTRQEQSLLFVRAEPYQELCPNCYLREEGTAEVDVAQSNSDDV